VLDLTDQTNQNIKQNKNKHTLYAFRFKSPKLHNIASCSLATQFHFMRKKNLINLYAKVIAAATWGMTGSRRGLEAA
jgi:carbonic anhydrase